MPMPGRMKVPAGTSSAGSQQLTRQAHLSRPALAYLRTSSAAIVGTDKDSETRQRHAIQGFAPPEGSAP